MTGESLTPRLGRLGSHCRLGVNDRESLDRGVTDNYDTGLRVVYYRSSISFLRIPRTVLQYITLEDRL